MTVTRPVAGSPTVTRSGSELGEDPDPGAADGEQDAAQHQDEGRPHPIISHSVHPAQRPDDPGGHRRAATMAQPSGDTQRRNPATGRTSRPGPLHAARGARSLTPSGDGGHGAARRTGTMSGMPAPRAGAGPVGTARAERARPAASGTAGRAMSARRTVRSSSGADAVRRGPGG